MTEDYIVEIKGSGKTPYKVNLQTYACTCTDWRNRRAQINPESPERLCKHLIKAICENGLDGEFPDADLQSLYKKKKGYPFAKADLPTLAAAYFNADLTAEELQRVHFLFGEMNSFKNFITFQELTKKGTTICYVPENKAMHAACSRLTWQKLAKSCFKKNTCDLLEILDFTDLKKIGAALGEKCGQRKTALKILSDHAELDTAFTEAGFDKNDFFELKPITLDMLR